MSPSPLNFKPYCLVSTEITWCFCSPDLQRCKLDWILVVTPFMSRSTTKPTKWSVSPAKTQISLGIYGKLRNQMFCFVLFVCFFHGDSEDSYQIGRMPRLIWIFAWRTGQSVGFVMLRLSYYLVIIYNELLFNVESVDIEVLVLGDHSVNGVVRHLHAALSQWKTKTMTGPGSAIIIVRNLDIELRRKDELLSHAENVSLRVFDQVRLKPGCSATEASKIF